MGQQMLQCDRTLRRAQHRFAGRVKALEHLRRVQRRLADIRHRRIEVEPALLDQLHRRDRGDRLGHRGDAEHGIQRHRRAVRDIAPSERAFIERPGLARGHRDDPRHLARLDRAAQRRVDLRLRFRSISHCFLSCRSPFYPQSRRRAGTHRSATRKSRMNGPRLSPRIKSVGEGTRWVAMIILN